MLLLRQVLQGKTMVFVNQAARRDISNCAGRLLLPHASSKGLWMRMNRGFTDISGREEGCGELEFVPNVSSKGGVQRTFFFKSSKRGVPRRPLPRSRSHVARPGEKALKGKRVSLSPSILEGENLHKHNLS